jgi:hypothetical protein
MPVAPVRPAPVGCHAALSPSLVLLTPIFIRPDRAGPAADALRVCGREGRLVRERDGVVLLWLEWVAGEVRRTSVGAACEVLDLHVAALQIVGVCGAAERVEMKSMASSFGRQVRRPCAAIVRPPDSRGKPIRAHGELRPATAERVTPTR